MNTFELGDLVTPDPGAGWPPEIVGKCYRITAVPGGSRKNYIAARVDGGRGLRSKGYGLLPWSDGAVPDEVVMPVLGAVVEVVGHDGYFVVIGFTQRGQAMRVAPLGGDENRYLTNVSPRRTTVVELDLEG